MCTYLYYISCVRVYASHQSFMTCHSSLISHTTQILTEGAVQPQIDLEEVEDIFDVLERQRRDRIEMGNLPVGADGEPVVRLDFEMIYLFTYILSRNRRRKRDHCIAQPISLLPSLHSTHLTDSFAPPQI